MKIKVSAVEIPVEKLNRAILWYEKALGYKSVWSDDYHAMLHSLDEAESVKILLVETSDPARLSFKSSQTNIEHSVIDLETDDLEKFHEHLKSIITMLPPIPEPANEWAPRGFSFNDSEGNKLAVFSYGD